MYGRGSYNDDPYARYPYGGQAHGSARRGGCLGCAAVLALFVGLVFGVVCVLAPTTVGLTARAYTEHAIEALSERLGVNDEEAGGAGDSGTSPDATSGGSVAAIGAVPEQYLRGTLDEKCQQVYDELLEGVCELKADFAVIRAEPDDISVAYKAMMGDHPELFWLDGSFAYTYSSLLNSVTVKPGYEVDPSEVEATRQAIEAEANAILGQLGEGATEYEVAQLAYEYIASNTDYVVGAEHNQTIQSVLLGHASVCAGYARAYQYLLHRAGVFCAYVEGSIGSRGEDHAWNLVRIDGQYAYVDPTWADPTYAGSGPGTDVHGVIYDYLCNTTDEILRDDHVFSDQSLWPECNSVDLDYYRRTGVFFDWYDEQAIDESFWRQVGELGSRAAFKFGSDEAYAQATAALAAGTFERDGLLSLAAESGENSIHYSYATSDSLRIVKLYW